MPAKHLTLKNLAELMEFSENNSEQIHQQTFKVLNHEWKKTKVFNEVELFVVKLTDDEELEEVVLTVQDYEWETALELGLEHFEEVENYEMCSKVKKLLETIKTK